MLNQTENHAPMPGNVVSPFRINLPQFLRSIGAMSLLAAISIFLLQGWENGNDVYRYLLLLGHTVGLSLLGFASGHWLREGKGARLLLMLALASVPANFAILGAFLYSQAGWDISGVIYPAMAHWRAGDLNAAILVSSGAIAVLAPMIYLGFMVLSRKSAARLTLLFLLSNAALLIPVRTPALVAAVVIALLVLIAQQSRSASRGDTGLKTFEGIIARLLLFAPLAVMVGRNIWLYAAGGFMFSTVSALVFILFRQVALQLEQDSRLRAIIETLSLLPALSFGLGVCLTAINIYPGLDEWMLPLFACTVSVLVLELSTRAVKGAAIMRRLAIAVLTLILVSNLFLYSSVAGAALCLLVGLAVLVYGYSVEQRIIFVLGLVTLLAGLVNQMIHAFEVFNLGSWSSLAALGISAILIGSLMERHGAEFKNRLNNWGQRFKAWGN